MKCFFWIISIALASVPFSAYSTSCTGITHTYFVLCQDTQCSEGVEKLQVKQSPICSRRTVVNDAPAWMLRFVERTLDAKSIGNGNTIYQVKDRRFFHRSERATNIDEFIKMKRKRVNYLQHHRYTDDIKLDFGELILGLDEKDEDWFSIYKENANSKHVGELKEEFESKEFKELLYHVFYQIVFWGSFLVALALTTLSTNSFYKKILLSKEGSLFYRVRWSLLTQVGVLSASAVTIFLSFDFWPIVIFVPFIIILWLIEATQIFLMWRNKNV